MEAFLKTCDAADLVATFQDLGVSAVADIALCEADDLCSDLNISKDRANGIIQKAKDAALFEKRKQVVQGTWKTVEDALAVESTKLFYKHLFETHPEVKVLFENADMEAQAQKLYKTVELATQYLSDIESLVPVLEELGERVSWNILYFRKISLVILVSCR